MLERFHNVISWLKIHKTPRYPGWSGYVFTKVCRNNISFHIRIDPEKSQIPEYMRMKVQNYVFDARSYKGLAVRLDNLPSNKIKEGKNGSITIHTQTFTINLQKGYMNIYYINHTENESQPEKEAKMRKKKNSKSNKKPSKRFSWSLFASNLEKNKNPDHYQVPVDVENKNQMPKSLSNRYVASNVPEPSASDSSHAYYELHSGDKIDIRKLQRKKTLEEEYTEYLDPSEWNPNRPYVSHDWERNNQARAVELARLNPKDQKISLGFTTESHESEHKQGNLDSKSRSNKIVQAPAFYNRGVNIHPVTQPGSTFEVVQEKTEASIMGYHNRDYFAQGGFQTKPYAVQNNEYYYKPIPDQIAPVKNSLQLANHDQRAPNQNNSRINNNQGKDFFISPPRAHTLLKKDMSLNNLAKSTQKMTNSLKLSREPIQIKSPPAKPPRQFLYPNEFKKLLDQKQNIDPPYSNQVHKSNPLITSRNNSAHSPSSYLSRNLPDPPCTQVPIDDFRLLRNTNTIADRKNKLNLKISETSISDRSPVKSVSKLKIPEIFSMFARQNSTVDITSDERDRAPKKHVSRLKDLKTQLENRSEALDCTLDYLKSLLYEKTKLVERKESEPCCSKDLIDIETNSENEVETHIEPKMHSKVSYEKNRSDTDEQSLVYTSSSAESFESVIHNVDYDLTVPKRIELEDEPFESVMNKADYGFSPPKCIDRSLNDCESNMFETLERTQVDTDVSNLETLKIIEQSEADLNFESLSEADEDCGGIQGTEDVEDSDSSELEYSYQDDPVLGSLLGEVNPGQKKLQAAIKLYMKNLSNQKMLRDVIKRNAFCRGDRPRVNRELEEYENNRLTKAQQILEILTDSGSGEERGIRDYVEQAYRFDEETDLSTTQDY